jgi:hypothetical protein
MKKSIKKKITPENEKYWEHVKRVAEEVGNWPIEKTMGVLNNPHRREERGEMTDEELDLFDKELDEIEGIMYSLGERLKKLTTLAEESAETKFGKNWRERFSGQIEIEPIIAKRTRDARYALQRVREDLRTAGVEIEAFKTIRAGVKDASEVEDEEDPYPDFLKNS